MRKRYWMIVLGIMAVLFGSLFYDHSALSKEEGEPTLVEVENLPLDEQGNLKVNITDGKLWDTIFDLQSTVDSLNASLVELQDRIETLEGTVSSLESESPQIITVSAHPNWMLLFRDVWADLIAVSDVVVPEGASVIVTTVFTFRCTEVADMPLALRYRANNTYNEERTQGSAEAYSSETVEIQHVWTNLPAGTYTFALQYNVYHIRTIYAMATRLALIVYPSMSN